MSIRLNGVDLGRWTLTSGTFYRPPVSVRRFSVESPNVHGVKAMGLPVFAEPQVTIALVPGGVSVIDSLETLTADLTGLLASPALVVQRVAGSRTEEAPAVLVSVSPADDFRWGSHAGYSVVLALPGVFLRDVAVTTTGLLTAGSNAVPTLAGTAPLTDPVVRFSASTDPAVTDTATGTGLVWRGTIASGSYVFADPSTMRAWSSTSASSWDGVGTDVSSTLDYPGPGRLQLWPATTEAGGVLTRTVSVTTTAPTMIQGRRAFL